MVTTKQKQKPVKILKKIKRKKPKQNTEVNQQIRHKEKKKTEN